MRIVAVLVLAFITLMPAIASESSPEQLFRQFGLFGTWARDCRSVATPANPHVEIHAPAPGVILEDDQLGPAYALNRYSVLAAKRLSSTRLEVMVLFHPGMENEERQKLIIAVRDKTRRTLFTEVVGGPVLVKDGIALWNHNQTPLLHKCD